MKEVIDTVPAAPTAETPPAKKRTPIWAYPLTAILFAVCVPIIIMCLPIVFVLWIWQLITAPFEKKKFAKSGYNALFPRYFWGITKTVHYKIYATLQKHSVKFEYTNHTEKDFDPIITYIIEKDGEQHFILCGGDLESLHFDAEQNEWVYDNDTEYHHNYADELKTINPFEFMKALGETKHPKTTKHYHICMLKKQIKYLEISKQQKAQLRADPRFIDITDILSVIAPHQNDFNR